MIIYLIFIGNIINMIKHRHFNREYMSSIQWSQFVQIISLNPLFKPVSQPIVNLYLCFIIFLKDITYFLLFTYNFIYLHNRAVFFKTLLLFFLHFAFYFQGCTCSIWRFPGQGSNQCCSPSLHQSHSNMGPKMHLSPTPQLMAMPDP